MGRHGEGWAGKGIAQADAIYEELPGVDHLFDKDPSCDMANMYAFVARVTK